MNRDMRMRDNWALLHAQDLALERDEPLLVVYNLLPEYLNGGLRQLEWKRTALRELNNDLDEHNIAFDIVIGEADALINWFNTHDAGTIVTDFHPLRNTQSWIEQITDKMNIPLHVVDTHNIIPCWVTSDKQEYAARTIRPKIHDKLDIFLEDFPDVKTMSQQPDITVDWEAINALDANDTIRPVDWIKPGEAAATAMLDDFTQHLNGYAADRNDPVANNLSNLSPYFHYGNLAPQRAVLAVKQSDAPDEDKDEFIEEAVVRRELSDNYCYYNDHYDSFKGFPDWAKATLDDHRDDERDYLYTKQEWEDAATHDSLWNAAQQEMVKTGKMHGYMRMYWAKKILEWTPSPERALEIAIYLNDKYELDGRDPNGYVGCAWSIGGVHDRAWTEREVYGKVRYMNRNGCERKFDVQAYIDRVNGVEQQTLDS
jgi:deoxyribodipyrimidine photo-lyase